MRTIGVVTTARADYGIYLPLLRKIQADSECLLHLIVTGMHLSEKFGFTIKEIEKDGFKIGDKIEMLHSSDSPRGIVKSMGMSLLGFAEAFERFRPDILVVLGDRFEMYTAALAALPFKIPIAHIHGGELTQGAIDDSLRHSITKMSHLHFVSTEEYNRRVVQLGEEPWRVTTSGAPALDNLKNISLLTAEELIEKYRFSLNPSPLLITFHPVTLEYEKTEYQIGELLASLEKFQKPIIFTLPNADTAHDLINEKIKKFIIHHPHCFLVENLGLRDYWSLMALADAMIGNSSSGIIEAPSFKLPVINIGTRQLGRIKAKNVIDVDYHREDIFKGIQKALRPEFREELRGLENPYDKGQASEKILHRLKEVDLDNHLLSKKFYDRSYALS